VCTRVVIYEPATGGRAALLARTVRSSARTECAVVLDSTRALRHCIDGMAPGDIIVYCCDVPDNALEILDDYGARSVEQIRPQPESEPCAGIASNAPAKAVARRPGVLGGF
jgi:hypothetical protein